MFFLKYLHKQFPLCVITKIWCRMGCNSKLPGHKCQISGVTKWNKLTFSTSCVSDRGACWASQEVPRSYCGSGTSFLWFQYQQQWLRVGPDTVPLKSTRVSLYRLKFALIALIYFWSPRPNLLNYGKKKGLNVPMSCCFWHILLKALFVRFTFSFHYSKFWTCWNSTMCMSCFLHLHIVEFRKYCCASSHFVSIFCRKLDVNSTSTLSQSHIMFPPDWETSLPSTGLQASSTVWPVLINGYVLEGHTQEHSLHGSESK